MGCDIHCYVEYRSPEYRADYWSDFGGRLNPGRNYEVFGQIAGVRTGEAPVVEPKGIPDNLSYAASGDWFLYINDEFADEDGYCSLEAAQRYAKYGSRIIERDGKPWKVEHPDWHTPTWLTADELEAALSRVKQWPAQDEYWAVLAAMRCLEQRGNAVRVVIWFDN